MLDWLPEILSHAAQMQAVRYQHSVLLSEKFVKSSASWILKHSGAKEVSFAS